MRVTAGTSSVSLDVQLLDNSGLAITGKDAAAVTALLSTLVYSLGNASDNVAFPALVDLAALTAPWTAGGIKERTGGWYRLDCPDGMFTTAGTSPQVIGEGTNAHLFHRDIHVTRARSSSSSPVDTDPSDEPITYAEAKRHLRIDGEHEREWIQGIGIPAVRMAAEDEAGISLITRTRTLIAHDAGDGMIRLPRGPVQAIVEIQDKNDATVSVSAYSLKTIGLSDYLVLLQSVHFPLTITYTAGYGDSTADIPANIRAVMLAHLAYMYDNRSGIAPDALDSFYRRYRSFAG